MLVRYNGLMNIVTHGQKLIINNFTTHLQTIKGCIHGQ